MAPNAALRSFPDARAVLGRRARLDDLRVERAGDVDDVAQQAGDLLLVALDLDDEQRLDVERVAGFGIGLDDRDRRPVHIFDGDGDDPRADDGGNALSGRLARGKADQHRPRRLGLRQDPQRRLGDDAELPLRADDEGEEIVALRIRIGPADLDDVAVDQHHLEAKHVVRRHAVLEAVRAPRVHGEVAADGAGELARWVGRVEEAFGRHRVRDGEIGDPGFDGDGAVDEVGFQERDSFARCR